MAVGPLPRGRAPFPSFDFARLGVPPARARRETGVPPSPWAAMPSDAPGPASPRTLEEPRRQLSFGYWGSSGADCPDRRLRSPDAAGSPLPAHPTSTAGCTPFGGASDASAHGPVAFPGPRALFSFAPEFTGIDPWEALLLHPPSNPDRDLQTLRVVPAAGGSRFRSGITRFCGDGVSFSGTMVLPRGSECERFPSLRRKCPFGRSSLETSRAAAVGRPPVQFRSAGLHAPSLARGRAVSRDSRPESRAGTSLPRAFPRLPPPRTGRPYTVSGGFRFCGEEEKCTYCAHRHTSTHPRVYELTPTCAEGACKLRVRLFICDPRGRKWRRQLTGTRSPGLWRNANAGRLEGGAEAPLAPALSVIYWSVFPEGRVVGGPREAQWRRSGGGPGGSRACRVVPPNELVLASKGCHDVCLCTAALEGPLSLLLICDCCNASH